MKSSEEIREYLTEKREQGVDDLEFVVDMAGSVFPDDSKGMDISRARAIMSTIKSFLVSNTYAKILSDCFPEIESPDFYYHLEKRADELTESLVRYIERRG